jgi:ankyrin repeat protein
LRAACQLDSLEKCLDPPSLQKALLSLPKTLHDIYNRILLGIPPEYKEKTITILQLLVFSERPMRIEEIVDAIAVNIDANLRFDPANRMPEPSEVTRYYSSLVTVQNEELHLSHFSVKEYLTSDLLDKDYARDFQETNARASLARVCVSYLLHLDEDIQVTQDVDNYSLAKYSARYWMDHAAATKGKDKFLRRLVMEFFGAGNFARNSQWPFLNCCRLYRPDRPSDSEKIAGENIPTPLYYASFGGLADVVQCLLDHRIDPNTQSGLYGNALQAASGQGHEPIIRLLLERNADINAQGGYWGTALIAAARGGHVNVVHLLLDKGANMRTQGSYYGNALQAAAARGHTEVCKVLIDRGADVNAHGGFYGHALQAASFGEKDWSFSLIRETTNCEEYGATVHLLLERGANPNSPGGVYASFLRPIDIGEEQSRSLYLLFDEDSKMSYEGRFYANALQAASGEGLVDIVQLLLDKGADVNTQWGFCTTGLPIPRSGERFIENVEVIIRGNANVFNGGTYCSNALEAASRAGHEKIVRLLLDRDANVNASDRDSENVPPVLRFKSVDMSGYGYARVRNGSRYAYYNHMNCLQAAAERGKENVVRILRDNGADMDITGEHVSKALWAASVHGHENIVDLLLHRGAKANAWDGLKA